MCLLVLLLACLWLVSGSAEGWYIGAAASPASRPLYCCKQICIQTISVTAALIVIGCTCLLWVLAVPVAR
jgi:hypothetical protein